MDPVDPPTHVKIADEAEKLAKSAMILQHVAKHLGVDRTEVVRALRWVAGKPVYPAPSHQDEEK